MAVVDQERISDTPFSGDPSGYTDEQYERACALDRRVYGGTWATKPPKERCSLPYRTPEGEISLAGARMAADQINSVVDASPVALQRARSQLRAAFRKLGETPPDSIAEREEDSLEQLAREFGVTQGVARHGETALRWSPGDGLQLREAPSSSQSLGTLHGHFAVFNRWTEINSLFEGNFLERLAPGAFKKTFDENKLMRCLLQHGRDPQAGNKPLGPITALEEDDYGARYEVDLLDTSYNRDLLPGLKAGLYGASFRFSVLQEEVRSSPARSVENPRGIEERTLREVKVKEFGPVTFPAYPDATAGARSLNDLFLDFDLEMFSRAHPDAYPQRLAEVLLTLRERGRPESALSASSERTQPDNGGERPQPAPPTRSPKHPLRGGRSGRLSGAAGTLKTSRRLEEAPKWQL